MLHGPFAVSAHRTVTLFFPFSLKGTTGFEAQIDKCLELAEYLYNKIKNREGYEMVFDGKVCTITVFFPNWSPELTVDTKTLPTGQTYST